jgi:hypothetical protein
LPMPKETATVMFSREELHLVQWCVLRCLEEDVLDKDMKRDAAVLLEELRYILGETAEDVGDRIAQQIARRLRDAYAATD